MIHNLKEEYVQSGNDLLGLEDEAEADMDASAGGGGADDSMTTNVVGSRVQGVGCRVQGVGSRE